MSLLPADLRTHNIRSSFTEKKLIQDGLECSRLESDDSLGVSQWEVIVNSPHTPTPPPPILSLSPTDTGRWSGRSGVTCFRSSSDHHLIFVVSPFNHHRLIIIIVSSYKRHVIWCSSDLVLIIDTMHHQREVRSHFLQIFISFPIFIQSYLINIKINMMYGVRIPSQHLNDHQHGSNKKEKKPYFQRRLI